MTRLKWSKWSKVTLPTLTDFDLLTADNGYVVCCQVSYVLCQQIQLCGRRDRYMTSDFERDGLESLDTWNQWLWIKSRILVWDIWNCRIDGPIWESILLESLINAYHFILFWSISHSPAVHQIMWSVDRLMFHSLIWPAAPGSQRKASTHDKLPALVVFHFALAGRLFPSLAVPGMYDDTRHRPHDNRVDHPVDFWYEASCIEFVVEIHVSKTKWNWDCVTVCIPPWWTYPMWVKVQFFDSRSPSNIVFAASAAARLFPNSFRAHGVKSKKQFRLTKGSFFARSAMVWDPPFQGFRFHCTCALQVSTRCSNRSFTVTSQDPAIAPRLPGPPQMGSCPNEKQCLDARVQHDIRVKKWCTWSLRTVCPVLFLVTKC